MRWEDFDYTYKSDSGNRFAYFGNGFTKKDEQVRRTPDDVPDFTPYLRKEAVEGKVDLRQYHESWYDL